ncbi:MAG: outer membrane protein assembly factor BamB family protein, partial [Vulcanimicrobiaceae bacterium]
FDGSVARLYVNGAQRASVSKSGTLTGYTTGFGLGLGDDAALTGAPFNGTLDEVAIYAGSALSATQVQNHYTAASAVATPSPTPGPTYVDWNTFGFDLARTGNNPRETTLSASNASALHLSWGQALGGIIDAQPVVATGISINGTPTTVLYIGTENGVFYALNANTGAILWQKQLGIDQNTCDDLPNNTFGISGTATFDRATNRVYLADGQLKVHALDMSTGQEAAGWPVAIASTPSHDHVYGALTYNPATHLIYAGTGGYCDFTPYQGRVAAIDTTTHALVQTFFTSGSFSGAGVWGMGGVSIDTTTNNVYAATGNTITSPESSAFGDQLLLLSSSLSLIAANYPGLVGGDVDFGATPLQLHFSGCPAQVVAKNKSGVLVVWNTASIASGPVQKLQMAADVSSGSFIGVPAYLASSGLVYVGDPSGFGSFTNGLIALKSQNCTLFLAWQQTVGTPNASDANEAPTVANGVVYFGSGLGKQVVAFNALTGQRLWDSGTTISGPVFAAPTVDGRLFIGSWDGKLYAFGL